MLLCQHPAQQQGFEKDDKTVLHKFCRPVVNSAYSTGVFRNQRLLTVTMNSIFSSIVHPWIPSVSGHARSDVISINR